MQPNINQAVHYWNVWGQLLFKIWRGQLDLAWQKAIKMGQVLTGYTVCQCKKPKKLKSVGWSRSNKLNYV